MKLTPQDEQVLKHLESGQHLTPLEALGVYNIFRLGARIWSIKQHFESTGDTRTITTTLVGDMKGKRYARYTLTLAPVVTFEDAMRGTLRPSPNPMADSDHYRFAA